MKQSAGSVDAILEVLRERAKELTCLYRILDVCDHVDEPPSEIFREILEIIPSGWQYPDDCLARITVEENVYQPAGMTATPWVLSAPIRVHGELLGSLDIFYSREHPAADVGPFLEQERKLIQTIAERLGQLILHRRLQSAVHSWTEQSLSQPRPRGDWWVIVDFLKRTDYHMFVRISRRMINFLCWNGVSEAQDLLPRFMGTRRGVGGNESDENQPIERRSLSSLLRVAEETFQVAWRHVPPEEILALIQRWIKDDRSGFLVEAVEDQGKSLTDIANALERYQQLDIEEHELSRSVQVELKVSLSRRFLTDHLEFINTAKNFVEVRDFCDLARHVICLPKSHGKVGGKSSGLFLATQIVRKSGEYEDILNRIRIPKTWYITSDGVLNFIEHNHLEDLYNRKYLEIDQVRREYPHIIQMFKNSQLSPEIVRGLSLALDDFDDRPLIVRSSSLLEDQVGSAFSGKYKSLFLANQGTKAERLDSLMDAISEVYASIFGPDPIEYRAERGLLDVHEEMGILLQEVVGTRIGRYYFPAFAGVAFSNNEFRWSPRIKRDDGLIRLVPGLGTRAVDRVGDDYPVLIAPGQPGLRVNVTPEDIVRYSPRRMDVIDLETRRFETVEIEDIVREYGSQFPGIRNIVSVEEDGAIRRPGLLDFSDGKSRFVATFDGLVKNTPFIPQMKALLRLLREKTGGPVDIEFASNGEDLFLLQCRPQCFLEDSSASQIPHDLPPESVVFSACRYVSNGRVPEITHIVYVDPDGYNRLSDLSALRKVGRAVGKLNKILPKRQFILMGPGRWGSRGDVKLGVPVTYSEINNTAVLIEIARKRGNYVPDLSFGTHFFQDLVEASIRYLPLFPDEGNAVFNERFLSSSPNVLADLAPEFSDLETAVRVIDVPRVSGGQILKILMNAEQEQAVAFLANPVAGVEVPVERKRAFAEILPIDEHSRWRMRMCERLAASLDAARYGVKGVYVFGSSKNGTAGPGSDIDLLVHVESGEDQREVLASWFEGWSQALAELNHARTGVKRNGLLDIHFVTDSDIARQHSYAAKINAVTDPARALELGKSLPS